MGAHYNTPPVNIVQYPSPPGSDLGLSEPEVHSHILLVVSGTGSLVPKMKQPNGLRKKEC